MTFTPTGLTWIIAARERAERAAYKLRTLEADPQRPFATEELTEAENELRAAVNHCEDSRRSLVRATKEQPRVPPATFVVHWPSGPILCCDDHARKLGVVAGALGTHVAVAAYGGAEPCLSCVNERRQAAP